MARTRAASEYTCQACGAAFPKWEGQCRGCGAWNSLVETLVRSPQRRLASGEGRHPSAAARAAEPRSLGSLDTVATVRRPTGLAEVDRLLGGGLVPGSLLLLGGEPGIGKSTLVLQVAGALAAGVPGPGGEGDASVDAGGRAPRQVLYASAEESPAQLHLRASRLGLTSGPASTALSVLASTDVDAIIATATALQAVAPGRRLHPDGVGRRPRRASWLGRSGARVGGPAGRLRPGARRARAARRARHQGWQPGWTADPRAPRRCRAHARRRPLRIAATAARPEEPPWLDRGGRRHGDDP